MNWVPVGELVQCVRHDKKGAKLFDPRRKERCTACDTDPGPIITVEPEKPEPPPKGCLSGVEHEVRLTELAEFVESKARSLCTGRGRINYATAAKLFEVALKAYNSAAVYTQTRERRDHVARLERRRRELHARKGRGGRN